MVRIRTFVLVGIIAMSLAVPGFTQVEELVDRISDTIDFAEQIVVLVDNSGSVKDAGRLPAQKKLAKDTIVSVAGSPEIAVATFNSSVTVIQPLTDDTTDVKAAIDSVSDTDNSTWMSKAIKVACDITSSEPGLGALVLMSDGKPTKASSGEDPVEEALEEAEHFKENCSIFVFVLFDETDPSTIDFCERMASREACFNTTSTSSDPPIWGDIITLPTPERFSDQDLNGDGDTGDVVLRYKNIKTGEVFNTGMITSSAYHAVDIYEDIIAFVGQDRNIHYYNIEKETVGRVPGSENSDYHVSIHGNLITFAQSEHLVGKDFNDDGDTQDHAIRLYDIETESLLETTLDGIDPVVYGDRVAFESTSTPKTIKHYKISTGTVTGTSVNGQHPAMYEDLIAFDTSERELGEDVNNDGALNAKVIRFYDLETQTATNTGAIGTQPSIHEHRIAFSTSEIRLDEDLNKDGNITGRVVRYYDLQKDKIVNSGMLGTQPDIFEDTIAFHVLERWAKQDINVDGDANDSLAGTYNVQSELAESNTTAQKPRDSTPLILGVLGVLSMLGLLWRRRRFD